MEQVNKTLPKQLAMRKLVQMESKTAVVSDSDDDDTSRTVEVGAQDGAPAAVTLSESLESRQTAKNKNDTDDNNSIASPPSSNGTTTNVLTPTNNQVDVKNDESKKDFVRVQGTRTLDLTEEQPESINVDESEVVMMSHDNLSDDHDAFDDASPSLATKRKVMLPGNGLLISLPKDLSTRTATDDDIKMEMSVPTELNVDVTYIDELMGQGEDLTLGEINDMRQAEMQKEESVRENSALLWQQLNDALLASTNDVMGVSTSPIPKKPLIEDDDDDDAAPTLEGSSPVRRLFSARPVSNARVGRFGGSGRGRPRESRFGMDRYLSTYSDIVDLAPRPRERTASLEVPSLSDSKENEIEDGVNLVPTTLPEWVYGETSSSQEIVYSEVVELRSRLHETQVLVDELQEERNYLKTKLSELMDLVASTSNGTDEEVGEYLKRKAIQVGELKAEMLELRTKMQQVDARNQVLEQEREANQAMVVDLSRIMRITENLSHMMNEEEEEEEESEDTETTKRASTVSAQTMPLPPPAMLPPTPPPQKAHSSRRLVVGRRLLRRLRQSRREETTVKDEKEQLRLGRVLTREEALELTVMSLCNKIESFEEERTGYHKAMDQLRAANNELIQEKDAYLIKISALEQQFMATLDDNQRRSVSFSSHKADRFETDSNSSTPKTEISSSEYSPPNSPPAPRTIRIRQWFPARLRNKKHAKKNYFNGGKNRQDAHHNMTVVM